MLVLTVQIMCGRHYESTKKNEDKGAMLLPLLKEHGVDFLSFVPDAGHASLIELAFDPHIRPVVLTTEEEGVALACGHWLGGKNLLY